LTDGAGFILSAGAELSYRPRGPAGQENALLKQETSTGVQPIPRSTEGLWAFFRGELVPLDQAKISVTTHAFNYGTAVFEGVRAYWNPDQEQLYGLDLLAHYRRLHRSAPILQLELRHSAEELVDVTCEMLRRSNMREDAYIRPILYKATEAVGVRLHNLETDLVIFTLPFGKYIDTESGIRAMVSSWRRNDDNSIPARAKITGGYVNGAFAKSEAQLNGFDEAIMLTHEGHVSEGSAENLFIVRDGVLITPAVSDYILEGITRRHIVEVAGDLGIGVVERTIGRTELYQADEVFLCGTGAQLAPVVEIDNRPIGGGSPGPITRRLHTIYFDAVRGRSETYKGWLTPVY
jgi:branched-chain amino acid aminotransferase